MRKITRQELADLEVLPISIPDQDATARGIRSLPFSVGQAVNLYTPDELAKHSEKKSARTDWFEKQLAAIHRLLQRPVPFVFRTRTGEIRSLDAGCLGYLWNQRQPDVRFVLDDDGLIAAVEPSDRLAQAYDTILPRLLRLLSDGENHKAPLREQQLNEIEANAEVNHQRRAWQAWPILIEIARKFETITYGELATQLGLHPRAIRYVLMNIQDYCLSQRLPPLTIVVVTAATRVPGPGFIAWSREDLDRGRQEVRDFAWDALENPFAYAADGTSEEELVGALVDKPDSAAEIFSRVRVRGMAQLIFRRALMRAYADQCALCGLTFEDALEASHLIPWGEASPQDRLDPGNGLLLCSTHHKLLDAGRITVSRSGLIVYRDPAGANRKHSKTDAAWTISLHGTPALLPNSNRHRPSLRALTRHHEIHDWGDLP